MSLGYGYYSPTSQHSSKPFYILDVQGVVMDEPSLNVSMETRGYNLYVGPTYHFLQKPRYQFIAGVGVSYSTAYIEFRLMDISDLKDENGETIVVSAEILSKETISLESSGAGLNAGIFVYPFKAKQ